MSGCSRLGWLACKWAYGLLLSAVLGYVVLGVLNDALMQRPWLRQDLQVRRRKDMMKMLEVALKGYSRECGKPPVLPDESRHSRSDEHLLAPLMGKGDSGSPGSMQFMVDCPVARPGLPGLRLEPSSVRSASLVDSWGEPYHAVFESSGDGQIPNPECLSGAAGKSDPSVPGWIPASMILFSSGPDRDPATWRDNICSWR